MKNVPSVPVFRSSPSSILTQTRQIVRKLIRFHTPDLLAIERPFLGYGNRSSILVTSCREIQQLAKDQGLEVIEINPKTAKKLVGGNGSVTKREIARMICSRFPELRIYLGQTHKYKDKYWQNMFDAVGIGLAAMNQCGNSAFKNIEAANE